MSGCGCGCADKKKPVLTDEQKSILEAIANSEAPCAGKEVAATLGLEPKSVSSKITALKKKGYVDSPVRCKYGITDEGRSVLKG